MENTIVDIVTAVAAVFATSVATKTDVRRGTVVMPHVEEDSQDLQRGSDGQIMNASAGGHSVPSMSFKRWILSHS